jgi:hypothetical protein
LGIIIRYNQNMEKQLPTLDLVVEAKNQYLYELLDFLTPILYRTFLKLWVEALNEKLRSNKGVYTIFKLKLESLLDNLEYSKKITESLDLKKEDDFMGKLIQTIFLLNTKILSIVKSDSSNKIKLVVPVNNVFLERVVIESAKLLVTNPILFENRPERLDESKINRNKRIITKYLKKAIRKAIQKFLPFKQILLEHTEGELPEGELPEGELPEGELPEGELGHTQKFFENFSNEERDHYKEKYTEGTETKGTETEGTGTEKSQTDSRIKSIKLPIYKKVTRRNLSVKKRNKQIVSDNSEKFFSD